MLELLKSAARLAVADGGEQLNPDMLRFTLEYQQPPDLAKERKRISDLLGADGFDLFYLSPDDDREIVILQFNDVTREQSTEFLFQNAQDLTDQLGVKSVTPDINQPWSEFGVVGTESLGDLLSSHCLSQADSPDESDWAINLIKAHTVHAEGVTGKGVIIGQPDTGVAEHREIDEGIDRATGYNFVENSSDPTDPMSENMRSPGHGTATASVAVSRSSRIITGSAPGATLVPLRVTNSVVLTGGGAVARGIDHARKKGCHVVTMSLGGVYSPAVRRAVRRAVEANMIVLAAAGNCVGVVVYPAWDNNVIAVAAVDNGKKRWKGSSHGIEVDVSAPGENVHVARRHRGSAVKDAIDDRGQGTSYAVALTAGCAALWLEANGVEKVHAHATALNTSVQELFRTALHKSAQMPSGWDITDMGAGIVNADRLVNQGLNTVSPLDMVGGNGLTTEMFSTKLPARFRSEVSFLRLNQAVQGTGDKSFALETIGTPQPSRQLVKMNELVTESDNAVALRAPVTLQKSPEMLLRSLPTQSQVPLPTPGTTTQEFVRAKISTEGAQSVLDTVDATLTRQQAVWPDDVDLNIQNQVRAKLEETVSALSKGMSDSELIDKFTPPEVRASLEALVRLTGRPALRVDTPDKMMAVGTAGEWSDVVYGADSEWRPFANAVGRVDLKVNGTWQHRGTGFLIEEDLILTNRHVLDALAEPFPQTGTGQNFRFKSPASINFDPSAEGEDNRFEIQEVVTAGAKRIGRYVNLKLLDMALLRINPKNVSGAKVPEPISKTSRSTSDQNLKRIMVVGYPARPRTGPQDPADTAAFWSRIREIYGDAYGEKYISPGRVEKRVGTLAGDSANWAFSHDATTLGGNSGSVIFSAEGQFAVCGIHFGGSTLTQNLAHDLRAVVQNSDGVFDANLLDLGWGPSN